MNSRLNRRELGYFDPRIADLDPNTVVARLLAMFALKARVTRFKLRVKKF